MKKEKFKYFIFAAAIFCMPLFSNVFALGNTSRVSLHLVGTSRYTLYQEGEIKQGPSSFSLKSLFGTSFSTYSFTVGSYGYIYSSFLEWRVPVDIVKGYDKVSFTLGSSWAYFNNASFTTGKGWLACQALSLPPTTTTFEGGFTSFVCDVDQTSIPESGEVTLYLSATLSRLLNGGNSGSPTITYDIFYQNDVIFYTNDATTIENSIKDQTDAINKQTDSFNEFKDTDLDESNKELPDDKAFNDYENAEKDLLDKVNQADLDSINIGIDSNSSNFVWDTTTRLIKSHPAVFGMFISILSIGIIKLALGR